MSPIKRKGEEPARTSKKTRRDPADQEYRKIAYGSINDPTPREYLDVKDLSLDQSYVGGDIEPPLEGQGPLPEKPAKKRWRHNSPKPLTDYALLPADWTAYDDDLDEQDLGAQIKRCKERIADNILPHIFEARFSGLEWEVDRRVKMAEREIEGLSWNVIERLQHLRMIGRGLFKQGDPQEKLCTVLALMEAYNSKKLDWNPGLVTYWQKGKQLCHPRPFDWDEYEAVQRANGDIWSFWVEGLMSPGPAPQAHYKICQRSPNEPWYNHIRLALRIPGVPTWAELDFLWDTGSTFMSIFQSDLNTILGPYANDMLGTVPGRFNGVPSVGSTVMQGVGGITLPPQQVVELEMTVLDAGRQRIIPWTRVQATINPGVATPNSFHRLDGPWLRSLLYHATAPDNNLSRQLILSTCKTIDKAILPALNVARVPRAGMVYGGGFFRPPTQHGESIAMPGAPGVPAVFPGVPVPQPMPGEAYINPGLLDPAAEPIPPGVPPSMQLFWGTGPAGPIVPLPPAAPLPAPPIGYAPVGGFPGGVPGVPGVPGPPPPPPPPSPPGGSGA